MTSSARLPALDGLRALAVVGVVAHHSFAMSGLDRLGDIGAIWPGPQGVRTFFLLSGCLLTGILWRARQDVGAKPRHILAVFYLRRACRILPLTFAAIGVAWLADLPEVRSHVGAYLSFTSNIWIAWRNRFDPSLPHFWTLAVEEQFYLVWPCLVLFVPRRALIPTLVVSIAGTEIARAWAIVHDAGLSVTVLLPYRWAALACGGLLAITAPPVRAWHYSLAAGVILAMVATTSPVHVNAIVLEWAGIAFAAATVLAAVHSPVVSRVFAFPPLVWLGTISFGIYVWHLITEPALAAVGVTWPHSEGWARFGLLLAAGVLPAIMSWWAIERWAIRLGHRVPYVTAHPTIRP